MQPRLTVTAQWDDDASVWVATSNDIPGLVTEASTLDSLVARIRDVAPELLEANAHLLRRGLTDHAEVDICMVSTLHVDRNLAH